MCTRTGTGRSHRIVVRKLEDLMPPCMCIILCDVTGDMKKEVKAMPEQPIRSSTGELPPAPPPLSRDPKDNPFLAAVAKSASTSSLDTPSRPEKSAPAAAPVKREPAAAAAAPSARFDDDDFDEPAGGGGDSDYDDAPLDIRSIKKEMTSHMASEKTPDVKPVAEQKSFDDLKDDVVTEVNCAY